MRVGVDLGGTKIEAVVLAEGGRVEVRRRVATPKNDYDGVLRAISALVADVERDAGVPQGRLLPVGIGTPGSLSPDTGLLRNSNSVVLNGRPFDRDITDALGREVRVANDANCFALAEAKSGAGQGAEIVFGVILGTGVGAGIVARGELVIGRNAVGGEWGHNPLPGMLPAELPGPECYCGRRGCVEAWCAGPALAAQYSKAGGDAVGAAEIAKRAGDGEALARTVLQSHARHVANALSAVVNILDPDVIVLGGGLCHLDHLYTDLPELMRPMVFSDSFQTPIRKAELGDSAGVVGAAWLWPDPDPARK
ncbi:MAG: ROK family protein [Pseudomonadota bacterium]